MIVCRTETVIEYDEGSSWKTRMFLRSHMLGIKDSIQKALSRGEKIRMMYEEDGSTAVGIISGRFN